MHLIKIESLVIRRHMFGDQWRAPVEINRYLDASLPKLRKWSREYARELSKQHQHDRISVSVYNKELDKFVNPEIFENGYQIEV